MDASEGSKHHGNGNGSSKPDHPVSPSLPSAVAALSGAPVSSSPAEAPAGAPEPLVVVDRDEHGKIKKGRSLNPKGRPPGIVNRNTQLNRGFETFRANPELCKLALKKYKIRTRGMKADELLVTLAFAMWIVDGDPSMVKWCGERVYLTLTPEAAGIVINNNPMANASTISSDSHVNVEKLIADGKGREAIAGIAERLAACGAFPGRNGNGN